MLTQHLLPTMSHISRNMFIFQQDSAPAHRARETIELLSRDTPDFIGPEMWPPNSPDLNPVDYSIWSVMEQRIYQEHIQNTDELRQRLLSGMNSSSRSLTMLSSSGEIVWQPMCEKRVDILRTHSKTVHLDSFLPLTAFSIKIH